MTHIAATEEKTPGKRKRTGRRRRKVPWHPYVRHLLRLFPAVRRVVVRVRELDRHLRRLVGVCVRRGSRFFLFLLLLRLGRGGQRPDALVVVVRREDLLPLRAVTRDARVNTRVTYIN